MVASFITENSTLLLSILAIVASIRSNWLAHRAHKLSKEINNKQQELIIYKQRTEILAEIDKQQAVLNRLATVTLQKMASGIHDQNSNEYKRLEKQVDTVNHLRKGYEEQRQFAYTLEKGACLNANERNLADIKRLTLHLEQDIENELGD